MRNFYTFVVMKGRGSPGYFFRGDLAKLAKNIDGSVLCTKLKFRRCRYISSATSFDIRKWIGVEWQNTLPC